MSFVCLGLFILNYNKKGKKYKVAEVELIEGKRKKLTDMLLDDLITKVTYDEKYNDLALDLHKSIDKRTIIENDIGEQRNIGKRMGRLINGRETNVILDEFSHVVFESIVEMVVLLKHM